MNSPEKEKVPAGFEESETGTAEINSNCTSYISPADRQGKSDGVPISIATPSQFLLTAFNRNETICVTASAVKEGEKWKPNTNGNLYVVNDFLSKQKEWGEDAFDGEPGAWIRINPIKPGDRSGTDDSV